MAHDEHRRDHVPDELRHTSEANVELINRLMDKITHRHK